MKFVTAAICAMLLTASTGAMAAGPYVGFSAGFFMPEDSKLTDEVGDTAKAGFDEGGVFSGVVGYAATTGVRFEGELSYREASMEELSFSGIGSAAIDADVKATTVMANIYYDIPTGGPVRPYFGAGVGVASVEVGAGTVTMTGDPLWEEDDQSVLAAQLALGVGIAFNEHVTLDLGYRYLFTEEIEFEMTDAEFASHNLTAGLRFTF